MAPGIWCRSAVFVQNAPFCAVGGRRATRPPLMALSIGAPPISTTPEPPVVSVVASEACLRRGREGKLVFCGSGRPLVQDGWERQLRLEFPSGTRVLESPCTLLAAPWALGAVGHAVHASPYVSFQTQRTLSPPMSRGDAMGWNLVGRRTMAGRHDPNGLGWLGASLGMVACKCSWACCMPGQQCGCRGVFVLPVWLCHPVQPLGWAVCTMPKVWAGPHGQGVEHGCLFNGTNCPRMHGRAACSRAVHCMAQKCPRTIRWECTMCCKVVALDVKNKFA